MEKKPVLQYDKHGNFLQEYDSIIDAEICTGIRRSNISRSLAATNKYTHKYVWKFKEINTIIDYAFIKKLFTDVIILDSHGEQITGLTTVTRKRDYVDLRMMFFKLCKDHCCKFDSKSCGAVLGQDHATVLHALSKFEYIYDSPLFIYKDLYNKFNNILVSNQLRFKTEITVNRQDVYRMTKNNLILKVLEYDVKIKELETLIALDKEVVYELVTPTQKEPTLLFNP
jgi:hypothetical protein